MPAENGACFSTAVRAYFQSVSNADSPPHAGLASGPSAPAEAQEHSVNRLHTASTPTIIVFLAQTLATASWRLGLHSALKAALRRQAHRNISAKWIDLRSAQPALGLMRERVSCARMCARCRLQSKRTPIWNCQQSAEYHSLRGKSSAQRTHYFRPSSGFVLRWPGATGLRTC